MFSGLELRKGAKVGMEWYPPWLPWAWECPPDPMPGKSFGRQRKYLDMERPQAFVM